MILKCCVTIPVKVTQAAVFAFKTGNHDTRSYRCFCHKCTFKFHFYFEVSPTGIRVSVTKIYCNPQKHHGGLTSESTENLTLPLYRPTHACPYLPTSSYHYSQLDKQTQQFSLTKAGKGEMYEFYFKTAVLWEAFAVLAS